MPENPDIKHEMLLYVGIFLKGKVMKKKLLVTASTFPRWEGDTEPRFVLDLSRYMTDEYDVTVLVPASPGAKDEEDLEGVHVIRYHYFPVHKWETLCYPGAIVPRIKEKKIRVLLVPFFLISLWFHLLKMLPEYDIVHAHWLIPQGIVQSFFKKPYIVTGHGGDVTSLNKGVLRKLKVRCLRRAKHVTVVSEHLKEKVQELVPEIEPSVISMGVDTTKFGKQYYVPNYFNQGEKKVILFVGRLVEIKGVAYLIEAMLDVDALLVIVGDGPLRIELEHQAKTMNELFGWEKIIFLGAKTHKELQQIYASAEVLVCPSVTTSDGAKEGFGLVILEAMASGIAVVASDSGGISQLIKDGENGLLCEEKNVCQLASRINAILSQNEMRLKICEGGKRTAESYGYANVAKLYQKLLNKEQGVRM